MRFFRWSLEWKRRIDSLIVPLWIQLSDFPFHLFNLCSLAHVCAPIGRLIGFDRPTEKRTRPSVARAKVEVDLWNRQVDIYI